MLFRKQVKGASHQVSSFGASVRVAGLAEELIQADGKTEQYCRLAVLQFRCAPSEGDCLLKISEVARLAELLEETADQAKAGRSPDADTLFQKASMASSSVASA